MAEKQVAKHEAYDVKARRISAWALAVVAMIASALAGVWLLVALFGGGAAPLGGQELNRAFSRIPTPRLETEGGASLRAFNADKRRLLESYGWVDRQAGIARIPIARAMDYLAKGGKAPPKGQETPP